MSKKNDGGPAYPNSLPAWNDQTTDGRKLPWSEGMTLRDYFAANAMQGMLAADGNDPRWTGKDTGAEHQRGGGKWINPEGVANQAYDIADAMLKAREQ